ncbi:Zn(II)2Cys6 transcription factor [Aspergillus neoniger CBS 115656]|uniref:C6 transcription factor n=1 Tax=Aspergillus neoniger (strain CBS 115656) TaxID=1448310 RepID=A0A318YVN8_ASPNB|nr:C6 transcription factor [Aspergillus neoniger CBS 115656]PYH38911.1 C6 transcription factor [Aspergillus neoniger CBS 115656]
MTAPRASSVSVQKNRPRQTGSLSPACDECRIRKVRCNKEYPKCSSCRASNLPCEFSNKGKRINHTKKLVSDVELLGSRLGKIEEALFRCLSVVEAANTTRDSTPTQTTSRSGSEGHADREESRRGSVESEESWSDGSFDLLAHGERDPEADPLHYSSPVTSLYFEAQAAGNQLISSTPSTENGSKPVSPRMSETLTRSTPLEAYLVDANELFQVLVTGPPPVTEPKYDDLPPALPPRTLLEGFVEAYFTDLNPFLPLYDRQSVLDAIQQQYGPRSDGPDLAWVCSFNSILLHTLEAKSSAAQPGGHTGDSTLERGLVVHLLLNARRCYNNFERLLQPRLANVQSLFSMALVALRYFSLTMFETVFAQACQLARTIGLHQTAAGAPQEAERRRLFWCLFIIDKHAALAAGKPCLLPSYACAIPIPSSKCGSLIEDQFTARIMLATILEELYRRLHSARSTRRGREQISRRAIQLSRRIEDWAVQHEHALQPTGTPEASQMLAAAELQYALYICRVLVQRRINGPESRSLRYIHARAGLQLLQELCNCDHLGGRRVGYALFASVTLNYSLIPFLEVYIRVLQDHPQADASDVALLTSFAARADSLAAQTTATSYTARVREVSALCYQVVTRLHQPPDVAESQVDQPTLPDPFWDLSAMAADAGWDTTPAAPQFSSNLSTHPDPSFFLDAGGSAAPAFSLSDPIFTDGGPVMFDNLLDPFAGADTSLGLMQ